MDDISGKPSTSRHRSIRKSPSMSLLKRTSEVLEDTNWVHEANNTVLKKRRTNTKLASLDVEDILEMDTSGDMGEVRDEADITSSTALSSVSAIMDSIKEGDTDDKILSFDKNTLPGVSGNGKERNTGDITPSLQKQPNKNPFTFQQSGKGKYLSLKSCLSKPSLMSIRSVKDDADKLARLLNIDNVKLIYDKIERKREFLDRIDQVTNDLLDSDPEVDPAAQLDQDVKTMLALFPDCDPKFLSQSLADKPFDFQRVQNLALELFDSGSYPKLKVREEKERLKAFKNKVLEDNFDVEFFLPKFPNPEMYFCQTRRKLEHNYKSHAKVQLENMFPLIPTGKIKAVLSRCKQIFTLAYREIQSGICKYLQDNTSRPTVILFQYKR